TIVDTIRVGDTVYQPTPILVQQPVVVAVDSLSISPMPVITPVFIPAVIDTAAVINDYFSRKTYTVPYSDSTIEAETDVVISQNAVDLVAFRYCIYQKNTLITKTVVQPPKWAVSFGLGVNYHPPSQTAGIDVLAALHYKRHIIAPRYDVIHRTMGVSYSYQFIQLP
ncbi:MAG: hypothetical protein PHR53_02475, partial [Bacteroidales bacterium]|nr:hypothetical protein [Bacteroidales bacterium]